MWKLSDYKMTKEMTLIAITVCAITLALVGNVSDAEAAAFMKLGDIKGESSEIDHEGWSDILSFSQAIHREGGDSTARSRGAAIVEDLTLTKELDKASPKLAESILLGKVFPKVEIQLASNAGVYFAYELTNVMITSYSISGGADDIPIEEFSLNFEEIKVTYTEMDSKGTKKGNIEYNWKVEEGTS